MTDTSRLTAQGSRLLAIFAHPDDESLLAGGTLASCAAAGLGVVLLCLTHGEQGPIAEPALATRETLGAVRQAELKAAAEVLGVGTVVCLDYPDGELEWADEGQIESDLARHIRRWRPEAVITFGPEGLYWHPDHIAVHRFTMAALDALKGEDLSPWVYFATWPAGHIRELVSAVAARALPAELWGLHPEDLGVPASSITTVIDVRPFLAAKLRALRSHRSQLDQNHLLHVIPDDVAEEFLGYEYFVRVTPMPVMEGRPTADTRPESLTVGAAASAGRTSARGPAEHGCPPAEDWLADVLQKRRAESSWTPRGYPAQSS